MLRVTQFSDTHFTLDGVRTHGGLGYDTEATWDAVHAHAFGDPETEPDLVVITGDLADTGNPIEYRKAAAQLSRIPVPANLCTGNHDFHVPFESHLPRPGLTMSRTLRLGSWLFVFADSNFNGREVHDDGRLHDKHDRIEARPQLGPQEVAWIDQTIAASDADHVFLWVHHPPRSRGAFRSPAYDAELDGLFARHERIRGMGAGHTHTDTVHDLGGRFAYTCPAFTINLDLPGRSMLPPGYRTYELGDDGSVTSTCHLLDDERWPRRSLPAPVVGWLEGTISFPEMQAEMRALGINLG